VSDAQEGLAGTLPRETPAGQARALALAAITDTSPKPTSLVGYHSDGKLLIIGPGPYARSIARDLTLPGRITVLSTEEPDEAPVTPTEGAQPASFHAPVESIEGYLGAFRAVVSTTEGPRSLGEALGSGPPVFDLVLDLSRPPLITRDVPPPGYYGPGGDEPALHRALEEIPTMVGDFEKPRYFRYDPDLCAHGARGVQGCTRCLDVCPTIAIRSLGETVAVDPHLCQGAGSCASACPTGAMTYAFPSATETLERIRGLLAAYREHEKSGPRLLFHDAEAGAAMVAEAGARLPESVVPLMVEEIGSVGLSDWLACLAYGAREILILAAPDTPASVLAQVRGDLDIAAAVLAGLGFPHGVVRLVEPADGAWPRLEDAPATPAFRPAGFRPQEDKRAYLRLVLDHLYEALPDPAAEVALPPRAAFGEVRVAPAPCTLCLACVAVCPTSALGHGEDAPQVNFVEWSCVQCGLCERACPEDAITLAPRLVLTPEGRLDRRVLHEEPPFLCVTCGKPFATRSIVEKMLERLADHRMFQGPARRRLEMCEDCRVRDMFNDES
jgi:ferredoxin